MDILVQRNILSTKREEEKNWQNDWSLLAGATMKLKLKRGDKVLIKQGDFFFRDGEPHSSVAVEYLRRYNSIDFKGRSLSTGSPWLYQYSEIVKVFSRKKRKGNVIGENWLCQP